MPDYQGIGLASALINTVGEYYKKLGYKLTITTSAKNMMSKMSKSKKWKCIRYGHTGRFGKTSKIKTEHRTTVSTASFVYIG